MYNRIFWRDHITDAPDEFTVDQLKDNIYQIKRYGNVLQKGTQLSAENLNNSELALFESLVAMAALSQDIQLQKDDLETVYNELLEEKEKLAKNIFYITDEKSVDISEFYQTETPSELSLISIKFPTDKKRINTDYYVIPFITNIIQKDSSGGCVDHYTPPLVYATDKKTSGFTVVARRFDSVARYDSFSFRCLVLGGI